MIGKQIMMTNTAMIQIIKGIVALLTDNTSIFAIDEATNRFRPTGGVRTPILKLTAIMTPNKIGSIPNAKMVGKKIGVKIIKIETASKNIPAISRIMLMSTSTVTGLFEIDKI